MAEPTKVSWDLGYIFGLKFVFFLFLSLCGHVVDLFFHLNRPQALHVGLDVVLLVFSFGGVLQDFFASFCVDFLSFQASSCYFCWHSCELLHFERYLSLCLHSTSFWCELVTVFETAIVCRLFILTFNLLFNFGLAHPLLIHLHNRLHCLFVLSLEVWLVRVDPFVTAHDKRCVVWVQTVESAFIRSTSPETHPLFLLEVFHLFFSL